MVTGTVALEPLVAVARSDSTVALSQMGSIALLEVFGAADGSMSSDVTVVESPDGVFVGFVLVGFDLAQPINCRASTPVIVTIAIRSTTFDEGLMW